MLFPAPPSQLLKRVSKLQTVLSWCSMLDFASLAQCSLLWLQPGTRSGCYLHKTFIFMLFWYTYIYIYIVGAPGLGSLQCNSVLDFTIEEWQAERTVPPWQVLDNWKSAESKPVFSSQAYASTKNGKSPKFLPSFFLFQCSAGHVAKQYEILGKHVEDYCCRL